MNPDLALYAVKTADGQGASFSEARIHELNETTVLLKNGEPQPAQLISSKGIGIRVYHRGGLAFAATNEATYEGIRNTVEEATRIAASSGTVVNSGVGLSFEKSVEASWRAEEKENIEDVGLEEPTKILKELDGILKDEFDGLMFTHRLLTLSLTLEEKFYVNSEGSKVQSRVPRVSFSSYLTTNVEGVPITITIPPGYSQLGESGGWEVVKRLKLHEYVLEEAKRLAYVLKMRRASPRGVLDVILGPNVVGLVAHESVGHPSEADRILGREAAQGGESYLKPKDIGLKIGSEEAYVSDDPTIPHSMGFYLYDDEGVAARKRRLVERGVVSSFLHDRQTAFKFKIESNGASRSSSFDREPIVRMANTFVEPGDHTLEELIEGVSYGIYIKSFMEWNIDDRRLNQRYVGLEAYLIENGEVKHPIREPIVELDTFTLWKNLDARAKDIEFNAATCGKGEPMQPIAVWTGGPSIRLRAIKVEAR